MEGSERRLPIWGSSWRGTRKSQGQMIVSVGVIVGGVGVSYGCNIVISVLFSVLLGDIPKKRREEGREKE